MNKLINRNTGQIFVYGEGIIDLKSLGCKNVAEMLEAGWEDYKEPKEHWCINEFGTPEMAGGFNRESIYDKSRKLVGNDFESKEEAEKAVEKLKAWKRLKDTITCIDRASFDDVGTATLFIRYKGKDHKKIQKDLDLLFGGEDED